MRRSLLLAVLAFFSPTVIAGSAPARPPAAEAGVPALPRQALGVPLVRQQTGYSCGPAALGAVLKYFGVWDGAEQQLYKILRTSVEEGTLPEDLAAGAWHFGLGAVVESGMTIARLRTVLASGRLVILEFQAWRDAERRATLWRDTWTDGHYAVLIGLDARFAYFMDPSTAGSYTFIPLPELEERWHDVNPVRPVPLEPRDLQLGVIIGHLARHRFPPPLTRSLIRLD